MWCCRGVSAKTALQHWEPWGTQGRSHPVLELCWLEAASPSWEPLSLPSVIPRQTVGRSDNKADHWPPRVEVNDYGPNSVPTWIRPHCLSAFPRSWVPQPRVWVEVSPTICIRYPRPPSTAQALPPAISQCRVYVQGLITGTLQPTIAIQIRKLLCSNGGIKTKIAPRIIRCEGAVQWEQIGLIFDTEILGSVGGDTDKLIHFTYEHLCIPSCNSDHQVVKLFLCLSFCLPALANWVGDLCHHFCSCYSWLWTYRNHQ